jgi:hypothetical protein
MNESFVEGDSPEVSTGQCKQQVDASWTRTCEADVVACGDSLAALSATWVCCLGTHPSLVAPSQGPRRRRRPAEAQGEPPWAGTCSQNQLALNSVQNLIVSCAALMMGMDVGRSICENSDDGKLGDATRHLGTQRCVTDGTH